MILITGASGPLGKSITELMLEKLKPSELALFVRDPLKVADFQARGVEVRQGDYSDYASLLKAFKGVDKLYFISGNDLVNRLPQHMNVVKAAKEAGIKHVVYTSFQRKDETSTSTIALLAEGHLKTEAALRESGMNYTIMKHGIYMDYIQVFIGDKVLESGLIYQPAGDGKTAWALRKDMAAAGVAVLTNPGHENKSYDIAGSTAYSYHDIAKIISEVSGKSITYYSPTQDEFIKTITGAGVPVEYAQMFAGISESIRRGEFSDVNDNIEKLTGSKPLELRAYLESVYGKKQ